MQRVERLAMGALSCPICVFRSLRPCLACRRGLARVASSRSWGRTITAGGGGGEGGAPSLARVGKGLPLGEAGDRPAAEPALPERAFLARDLGSDISERMIILARGMPRLEWRARSSLRLQTEPSVEARMRYGSVVHDDRGKGTRLSSQGLHDIKQSLEAVRAAGSPLAAR